MLPGRRVMLNVTLLDTAPFGTMSFSPFGIETLPPAGPIIAVAVACVTALVQSNPVTVVNEVVAVVGVVELRLDPGANTGGEVVASPHAVAATARNVAKAQAPKRERDAIWRKLGI